MTATPHTTQTDAAPFDDFDLEQDGADPWGEDAAWSPDGDESRRLARMLGLFSIGLGLSQVLAPRAVSRAIGLEDTDRNRTTMRAFGFRETATGVGLLTRQDPTPFAWGRVIGDVMDLAVLGRALASPRSRRRRVAAAAAAVIGVTVLDILASQGLGRADENDPAGPQRPHRIRVKKAITINATAEDAYGLWRNLANLPRFMDHLEAVVILDERRSHWKAKAPLGAAVEWDAEITADEPNERIAWRSVEGAGVPNQGEVRFSPAPGDRGVEVRVDLTYDPPGGAVGATIAKLFGEEPSVQIDGDLRRFKQMLELGEVVSSDASIHRTLHPARPSAEWQRFEGGRS